MPYIFTLLSKLIRARTVNYDAKDYPGKGPDGMQSPGEEFKVAKIVEKEFSKAGVKFKVFNKGKRPDVIAFIGQNKPGYRKLLLAAHMDTVPGGEGWTITKPFVPKKVGNRMYGRGATDDKGPLAALIASSAGLKKIESKIRGQIIIAAVSDEEVNMCPGLVSLVKNKIIAATDAIIPDVGCNMKQLLIAEKGRLRVSVKSIGKSAHASIPDKGKNAIDVMSQFLVLLSRYQLKHEYDALFPDGPTMSTGLIKGGTAANQVPCSCESVIDIRYLPSQKPKEIIRELAKLSSEVPGEFIFSVQAESAPMKLNPGIPIVSLIKSHAQVKLAGMGGITVSKVMHSFGIDSVGFGPGDEGVAHVADEYVDLKELERFSELISKIAVDVANTKTF
jgi:succinyl-diaminopimelate desuccinylase